MAELDSFTNDDPQDGDEFVLARNGDTTLNALWENIKTTLKDWLRALDLTVTGAWNVKGERFEAFGGLNGDNGGSGVFTDGYRAYIGLIPLVNSGDKEFVKGQVSGARGTYDNGGSHKFYAENDPFNDGSDITLTSSFVKSVKGKAGARLVQFDYDEKTWVGLEISGGGRGINQEVRFKGRKISDSGSENIFPQVIDFSNISNLAAYSGNKAFQQEEYGTKDLIGELRVRGKRTTDFDDPSAFAGRDVKAGTGKPSDSEGKNGDIYIQTN